MSRETDIAWAAGLFEGEGSISCSKRLRKRDGKYTISPVMCVAMTDEDIVGRFNDVVQCGSVYGPQQDKRQSHYKPIWEWNGTGSSFGLVYDLLEPFLGERRKAQYEAVCKLVEENGPLNHDVCKRGHSDWGIFGGLRQCKPCRKAASDRWVERRKHATI